MGRPPSTQMVYFLSLLSSPRMCAKVHSDGLVSWACCLFFSSSFIKTRTFTGMPNDIVYCVRIHDVILDVILTPFNLLYETSLELQTHTLTKI